MPRLDLSPSRPLSTRIQALADALDASGDAAAAAEVREAARAYRERLADGHVPGALAALARLDAYQPAGVRRRAAA